MLIDEIIPYERNARHNEKAIPVVADSIREFGLRGQILLESRDNPVIVTGHTRVAACKSLGWTEIPDEHIAYCDDMTEDQIRAFRIADNKTGEIATWNSALLRREAHAISTVDMSKFGCDFVAKKPQFVGAERLRTDQAYNLDLISRFDCDETGMPPLEPCDVSPEDMIGFNYMLTTSEADKAKNALHFYVDDYQFERVWNSPKQYVEQLRGFECVLTPDFSLYMDMPLPMQIWNAYRGRALGYWWQKQGIRVIPSLTWAQPETYSWTFLGLPKHSTVAVSTKGVMNDKGAKAIWRAGMEAAMELLEPTKVLLYGVEIDFDFGDAEVLKYTNSVTERMAQDGRTRSGERD